MKKKSLISNHTLEEDIIRTIWFKKSQELRNKESIIQSSNL